MRDELFNELLDSVRDVTEMIRGDRPLGRMMNYKGKVLIEIREGPEVVWSLRDAAHRLGQRLPVEFWPLVQPPIKHIRESLNQTQEGFAQLLGVSVDTVRKWEQGKRNVSGPARTLLRVTTQNPEALLEAAGLLEDS